ncbi:MAG: hypothetical protein JRC89_07560 [Deltaproteobacteria bacterium]|nr:hypothetical protein [Deltaproteobacteria bacterium]
MKKFIGFLVFLAAFAMVFGFTITAAMADVDLYGSVRFRTYWADKDKDFSGTGYDDEDLEWRLGHLSRWGVNYKSGDVRGKVELDARATDTDTGSSMKGEIRVRHLYGEWDFGKGKLLIGQTFNPCTVYSSGIGYYSGGIQKFGGLGLRYFRTSQIRLTFDNLVLAFMTPDHNEKSLMKPDGTSFTADDTDLTFPRLEARYSLKLDPVTVDFMGGWQTYDVVDALDHEETIDSYQLGVYARTNFGPAYVKGVLTYAQNGGNYGLWSGDVVNQDAMIEGGSVQDAECWGGSIVAGYKVSDTLTFEGSVGFASAENDDTTLKNEDDAQVYTLLAKITLAPGVTIQPELIFEDRDDKYVNGVKTEQGDAVIGGIFWMINFK